MQAQRRTQERKGRVGTAWETERGVEKKITQIFIFSSVGTVSGAGSESI